VANCPSERTVRRARAQGVIHGRTVTATGITWRVAWGWYHSMAHGSPIWGYRRGMASDLEREILTVLQNMRVDGGPASFAQLARRCGATPGLIASCAKQMIDKGIAEPSMVTSRGVATLHGLMPQAKAVATS
jgi:hypothetical protein